ncbi:MAG: hypothetical protein AAGF95_30940, partial [Chloroflexota bacterium]
YDLTQPDFVTQGPIQRVDLPEGTKLSELQWKDDGHYVLVSYKNVLVITGDGDITSITTSPSPALIDSISLLQDDEFILTTRLKHEGATVRTMPFDPDNIPSIPTIKLPNADGIYEIVYTPDGSRP